MANRIAEAHARAKRAERARTASITVEGALRERAWGARFFIHQLHVAVGEHHRSSEDRGEQHDEAIKKRAALARIHDFTRHALTFGLGDVGSQNEGQLSGEAERLRLAFFTVIDLLGYGEAIDMIWFSFQDEANQAAPNWRAAQEDMDRATFTARHAKL